MGQVILFLYEGLENTNKNLCVLCFLAFNEKTLKSPPLLFTAKYSF